jgi:Bacterial Ig-like domain (group 3)
MGQRDKGIAPDFIDTGLPPVQSGQDVPRWLVILAVVAGITVFVALLRYAVDLLGVVFVIILVGFAIRTLSDWLTEGESVSGWTMAALGLGLSGSVFVSLWLLNSNSLAAESIARNLPAPVRRTLQWLELHGWGQRVLLPGGSGPGVLVSQPPNLPATAPAASPRSPDGPAPLIGRPAPAAPAPMSPARAKPMRRASGDDRRSSSQSAEVAATPPPEAETAKRPTRLVLTNWPAHVVVGQSARLTAQVLADSSENQPTGSVEFAAGQRMLGRAVVRNGIAVLVTLDLPLGDHTLVATYDGDARHLASQSAPISLTVTRR